MKNMNLLFVLNTYPGPGGVETVTNNIIEYLSQNHQIYTLSSWQQLDLTAPASICKMYKFAKMRDRSGCVALLNDIIDRHKIDVIINQGLSPGLCDIIFDKRRREDVKVLSFLHGVPKYEEKQYEQLSDKFSWRRRLKLRLLSLLGCNNKRKHYLDRFSDSYINACRLGDRIVLLCDEYKSSFIEAYGVQEYEDKIIAIPNSVSTAFSTQPPIEWDTKRNCVLFVGRLSCEKRVEIILDVWRQLHMECNWELVIVGDGEERGELEKIVRNNMLPRVTFAGWQRCVELYYNEAKIILMSSKFEGFPMSLIEAQRFGVVPLSFDISAGVQSLIVDTSLMLVPQDDTLAMVGRLREFIANDDLLRELSDLARKKSEQYTINIVGIQWERLLAELDSKQKI